MKTKTLDQIALRLLLEGRTAEVKALAKQAARRLEGRLECPECGNEGPHDDNGEHPPTYLCVACGYVFEDAGLVR